MVGIIGRTLRLLSLGYSAYQAKRATDPRVAAQARLTLIDKMGRLHGLPQKLGQILSMGSGETRADFRPLTEQAEALPLDIIQAELAAAWNRPVHEVVPELSPQAMAASLGQVHRAKLQGGDEVAVKIRYPGVETAVINDLNFLGWLSLPVGGLQRGFDMAAYKQEILRDLDEELDYRIEAEHQARFAHWARRHSFLIVPEVLGEWTRENVLVTRWETGATIDEVVAHWPAEDRRALGRNLIRLFFELLFDHGVAHADPHVGNYRFRLYPGDPRIVLYDFGSVVKLTDEQRRALIRLILAVQRGGAADDPYPIFLKLGFRAETLEPLRTKLPALCQVLFEPLRAEAPYNLAHWRRGERVADVLGDDQWNFRISGPADLILLMRAFHGLVYYLERLGESINWHWQIREVLARQAASAWELPLPTPADPRATFAVLARYLQIQVLEGGRTKVKVTLPALAVDELDDYLDGDVRAKIAARGIDLAELVREVRRGGYRPRSLLQLDEPPKTFRVWLE